MAPAIKVDRPFATVQDTAKTLGVPKSRTDELIRRVKDLTDRIMRRSGDTDEDEDEDESREDRSRAEPTTTVGEKKGKHHADKHARKAREKKEKEARERR